MPKTLLFVGAHPDDESFGPGATLAQYASSGVKVYYICATGGESGTVEAKHLRNYPSVRELRQAELMCAAAELGLADVYYLGYRDSGMPGSPDNDNPEALSMAPIDDVTDRIVKIIRNIKPQVVLTHDPRGDYGHPDHVAVHNATTAAFHAAGNGETYHDLGAPFQPQKLYYNVMPNRLLKMVIKLLPLFGQNPKCFGRNRDIDLTTIVDQMLPVTTIIKLNKQSIKTRQKASNCHRSQIGGGGSLRRVLSWILDQFGGQHGTFSRVYPPITDEPTENDLFQRVKEV